MIDYVHARQNMVRRQLVARGISDARVLDAMGEVPRHLFVSESIRNEAYEDTPLPIGDGQTISQPYMVAIMTELLGLKGHERVLEIGTGSGYQAAVLSRLCHHVYTVERLGGLSDQARRVIEESGYTNITFIVGDGTLGFPDAAPYDGIIVTAGAPQVPDRLVEQLEMGGKLVIPVGDRFSQTLKRVIKTGSGIITDNHTGCRFVDLIGEYGW
ncbi:MAG TPA: protein-L-isoaspartate(D-aspartate) O-methyltransferase [Desulfomonilaceae bacterium]|nr:protein-L-isoaspartate(D-aspartate) O-methyltransferase [Desulfomonilaceae bacterium]